MVSHNVFSALSKSRKSKPSSKPKPKKEKEPENKHAELEQAIFSAPAAPMTNWADDSEEELELPVTSGMGSGEWNEVRGSSRVRGFPGAHAPGRRSGALQQASWSCMHPRPPPGPPPPAGPSGWHPGAAVFPLHGDPR